MKQQLLEAGQIVNTHGVKGEVKIVPWCDSPDFLCGFSQLYIDKAPVSVLSARPAKGNVLVKFQGVDDVNAAMRLKNKIVFIDRNGVKLPDGRHFLADLIGLEVRSADTGAVIGTLTDVLMPPAHEVYVVSGNGEEHLIPAVDEFLVETNVAGGYIRVRLIEGM